MRIFGRWLLSVGGLGQDSHQNGSRLPTRIVYCESAAISFAVQPVENIMAWGSLRRRVPMQQAKGHSRRKSQRSRPPRTIVPRRSSLTRCNLGDGTQVEAF